MKNKKEILKKLEEIRGLIIDEKLDEVLNNETENKTEQIKWTKIGNLEWSECLGEMNWYDATKKAEELGGRLPTRVELLDLYDNHSDECKDFVAAYYWSSAEYCAGYAWGQNFSTGGVNYYYKTNYFYVRCVRSCK